MISPSPGATKFVTRRPGLGEIARLDSKNRNYYFYLLAIIPWKWYDIGEPWRRHATLPAEVVLGEIANFRNK